jgi:hypothetical protein
MVKLSLHLSKGFFFLKCILGSGQGASRRSSMNKALADFVNKALTANVLKPNELRTSTIGPQVG